MCKKKADAITLKRKYDIIVLQLNLDLSFFKGMEKQNDECGKTINPGNFYTLLINNIYYF